MKSPQTNGICERFHKTILQEFYQVAFRKKLYDSIDALQADLDDWLHHYNHPLIVCKQTTAGQRSARIRAKCVAAERLSKL